MRMQAAENIGWGRANGGGMWGNVAEAPNKPFSTSGHRLANVLYIHYLSKVPYNCADSVAVALHTASHCAGCMP